MTKKESAHPTAVTVERAEAEKVGFGEANFPVSDFSTAHARRQVPKVRVADFLSAGEQNGQTLKQLHEIFPGDGRSIRAQIERERRDTPILSGQSGYYLPACEDEVRRFLNSMRHRGRQIMTSAANVERAYGLTTRSSPQLGGDTNG